MVSLLHRRWSRDARCGQGDLPADLWVVKTRQTSAEAVHICQHHCPVRAECEAEALATRHDLRSAVVLGGTAYTRDGQPMRPQPHQLPSCRLCPEQGAAMIEAATWRPDRELREQIRAWAVQRGLPVGCTGPIARRILAAYLEEEVWTNSPVSAIPTGCPGTSDPATGSLTSTTSDRTAV